MKIDKDILRRYADGNCSAAEKALVEEWFEQYQPGVHDISDEVFLQHLSSLDKRVKQGEVRTISYWQWSAAAVVILAISISLLVQFNRFSTHESRYLSLEDIKAPISSNAVIVLEDDTEYSLDSLQVADTLYAKGYLITKLPTGELHYMTDADSPDVKVYNTLRTKAGGIAHVKLSDGSLVWLNTHSELVYPVHFGNGTREVQLKGEGYFEIAKGRDKDGASRPFYIRGEAQTIQVLGTKFNANFTTKQETALLEGRIAIANEGSQLETTKDILYKVQLQPKQLYKNGYLSYVQHIGRYIDWKEGYFDLNDLTLYELADKLSNWYGVEIHVGKGLEENYLFGRVSRNKDLKDLLELVTQASPVKIDLKNDKVYINKLTN